MELIVSTPGSYLLVLSACGSPASILPIEVLSDGGWLSFTVSPNPANDLLRVSVADKAADNWDTRDLPTFEVVLFDGQDRPLRQGESKDGEVQFDTRTLPEGTYFLHIHHDGEVEKRQVLIRHE